MCNCNSFQSIHCVSSNSDLYETATVSKVSVSPEIAMYVKLQLFPQYEGRSLGEGLLWASSVVKLNFYKLQNVRDRFLNFVYLLQYLKQAVEAQKFVRRRGSHIF
jgi:hypothetical protein